MVQRPFSLFLTAAALGIAAAWSGVARAASCTSADTLGQACSTAGPNHDLAGICESTPCSADDGGASANDAGSACFACLVDGTAGLCGGGKSHALGAALAPTGGCCSVAGTSTWGDGAGLLGGGLFLAFAWAQRRRVAR